MSELAERGARRIEWARDHMPVLAAIRDELKQKKSLRGLRIGMALHVEAKTGVLALSLKEAGAQVRLASCNPLSTDDSVAAALRCPWPRRLREEVADERGVLCEP